MKTEINPYGITDKFAVGGLGTGGYLSLCAASLWDYEEELLLAKFMDTSQDIDGDGLNDAVPYIIPEFYGNLEGTDTGIVPGIDSDGDGVFDVTNVPFAFQITLDIVQKLIWHSMLGELFLIVVG